jgi:hypothetical protein
MRHGILLNYNACSLGQQCPINGSMQRITQTDLLLCILESYRRTLLPNIYALR